ncbi:hypothetical protein K469DRAFT_693207 [Zopfia rhizophila CBS 207.26]|uniref:Heterokaryon incompatibility domain-containing protein n=1 Tax=Zopfia rhizophila CBS 207.26 TaxID=1314779 RepID=A0A6A6EQ66_9PEZI|nr:hypothetical protein K469DRAFT_693207 [Zopfia rhizophila CBS 207.26]
MPSALSLILGSATSDGADANAGLRAVHESRNPHKIAFYDRDIRLKCTQPAEYYIREPQWNTRGWTFQEWLLSPRNLIFAGGHILAAFNGIGNLVCDTLGGCLIYGLPSSHFDWALLWKPGDAAARREREDNEHFPTWSWCGMEK